MLLASIPSPSDPFIFHLGPLAPRWYGVLLAVGILVAILVTRQQLALRGRDPALAGEVAIWAVPFGVVGARLYHVVTDWSAFSGHLGDIPLIQQGGLGIYGAILGGAIGATIGARRYGVPLLVILDCTAPGTALAQAHRALRQLRQPGALRRADEPALGARDRPGQPPGASTSTTRPSTRRSCTSRSGT